MNTLLLSLVLFTADTSQSVCDRLNGVRWQNGSPPLKLDTSLNTNAMTQARMCAAANAQFHSNSILYGVSEGVCDQTNDPVGALTYPTAPLHRADALNKKWTRLGVGWAYSTQGRIYWVLQYGR